MGSLSKTEMLLLSQIGFTLYKEGQYEKAIAFFEGLAEMQPNLPQFRSVLALLYHLNNKPQQALMEGLQALKLKPNDVSIMTQLGEVYLTLNQIERARDILTRAYQAAQQMRHPGLNRIALLLQQTGAYLG